MTPTGEEDLTESDEQVWAEIDDAYEATVTEARLEAAVVSREAQLRVTG